MEPDKVRHAAQVRSNSWLAVYQERIKNKYYRRSVMEYKTIEDLPDTLKESLPNEAQNIYIKAFKNAWDNYEERQGGDMDRESVAHRQAMKKVRDEFTFHEDSGNWYRQGEEPEVEEEGSGIF
jgi:cation transport regulator